MTRIIAVHSYRGGTGKTHFSANLATTLARQGRRVAVVDADVPSPGIHNLFGVDAEGGQRTLNHFLWGEAPIPSAATDVTSAAGLAEGEGRLWLVPSSARAEDIARVLKDGYDVRRLNDGLKSLAQDLALDFLFIDTHPGLSKETFLSMAIAHLVVLVLRPDKQDYQGTAVTLDVARQLRVRNLALVVNKVHRGLDPEELRAKVEQTYSVPVAGVFPLSEDVARLASAGVFCSRNRDHPVSRELERVAAAILAS
jgi:MinD-like ATPase involved in chromosome partitioning or flagellar assembly